MGILVCFGLWYHNRIRKNRPFELKKYLNEEEYYKVLMQSKAILDITEPGNEWLTLRPVEALYLGKKLITNNRFITEEKLYCKKNVFILGADPIGKLKDFIESGYEPMNQEIKDYYSALTWLNRFMNGEG